MPAVPEATLAPTGATLQTAANSFGVYRVYHDKIPTYVPDTDFDIHRVSDHPTFSNSSPNSPPPPGPFAEPSLNAPLNLPKSPYETQSEELLMSWYYTGSNSKSLKDLNVLVHNVIGSKDFRHEELRLFDAAKSARRLDLAVDSAQPLKDGWKCSSVLLPLPHPRHKFQSEEVAPTHKVEGLLHRRLTEVIRSCYKEKSSSEFHIAPFEEYWAPNPNSSPERIYSELYNSNALLEEHDRITRQPSSDGLKKVIMPIMNWSDATHLTSFGDASLWPIYLHNGYQSKYTRAKPTSFAAHHVAYIPKVCLSMHWYRYLMTH